ncbi:MAG: hypothetical protein ACOYXC_00330 [Candidatus Rifleibacteriota bacterium]
MSASVNPINPMIGCRDCGRLFMRFSREICPDCREKEQTLISRIVSYASVYPRCDVSEISKATGISKSKIISLVHEGLLRRFGLKFTYPCRICGSSIDSRNLCYWCSEKLYRLIDELRDGILNDTQVRQRIEAAGLRPDLREEDWEKAAMLFSDNAFRSRNERNIVFRHRRSGNHYR